MRATRSALLALAVAWFPAVQAQAPSAIETFRGFVQSTQSARGSFTQTVIDPQGKTAPPASGTLAFQRPGKFRWIYDKPAQTIIGDGRKVWLYDRDLNQVTVRALDAAFSSTPAALLAGRTEVEAAFTLVAGGEAEGLNWVRAEPKKKEAGIESMRLGFAGAELHVLELADAFGNRTRIAFSKLERNVRFDAVAFVFTPPKGADVVGE